MNFCGVTLGLAELFDIKARLLSRFNQYPLATRNLFRCSFYLGCHIMGNHNSAMLIGMN